MKNVTVEELENNLDEFIKIGQEEEIMVSKDGKHIFTIVPQKVDLAKRWEAIFGTLPRAAFGDDDIDRE